MGFTVVLLGALNGNVRTVFAKQIWEKFKWECLNRSIHPRRNYPICNHILKTLCVLTQKLRETSPWGSCVNPRVDRLL